MVSVYHSVDLQMRYSVHYSLLLVVCFDVVSSFVVVPSHTHATQSHISTASRKTALDVFDNLFAKAEPAPAPPKNEPVVIDRDFRVAGAFLAAGALLDTVPYAQWFLGLPVTALGLLFLVQTFRLRFVFDEDNNLELRTGTEGTTGENIVVGGANKWACSTIVNYDFFPSGWIDNNPVGPILVYFKETQTDSATWNEGPGASANDPAKIAAGQAVAGQVHFFPAICSAQQIRAEFEKRQCGKIEVE